MTQLCRPSTRDNSLVKIVKRKWRSLSLARLVFSWLDQLSISYLILSNKTSSQKHPNPKPQRQLPHHLQPPQQPLQPPKTPKSKSQQNQQSKRIQSLRQWLIGRKCWVGTHLLLLSKMRRRKDSTFLNPLNSSIRAKRRSFLNICSLL